jgi:hypothetical protein
MRIKNILIISALLLMSVHAEVQNLTGYMWENRLLVVLTDSFENQEYQKQIAELVTDTAGLKERRLIIYHAAPEKFAKGIAPKNWEISSEFYSDLKKLESPFEVILIGLDGGVKLRKDRLLSLKELFGTIDAMPMRMNELRLQKSQK